MLSIISVKSYAKTNSSIFHAELSFGEKLSRSLQEEKYCLLLFDDLFSQVSFDWSETAEGNPYFQEFLNKRVYVHTLSGGGRIQEARNLIQQYTIESFPCLLVVDGLGKVHARWHGYENAEELVWKVGELYNRQGRSMPALPSLEIASGFRGDTEGLIIKGMVQDRMGIIVDKHKEAIQANHVARRWKLIWDGPVWLHQNHSGDYMIVLTTSSSQGQMEHQCQRLAKAGIQYEFVRFKPDKEHSKKM